MAAERIPAVIGMYWVSPPLSEHIVEATFDKSTPPIPT